MLIGKKLTGLEEGKLVLIVLNNKVEVQIPF